MKGMVVFGHITSGLGQLLDLVQRGVLKEHLGLVASRPGKRCPWSDDLKRPGPGVSRLPSIAVE